MGLWDAKLAWYSQSTICQYGLKHSLKSIVLGVFGLAWLLRFLQQEQSFLNNLFIAVLW